MPFFGGWVLDDLGSALPVIQNRLNNFLSFDLKRERRRLDAHLRPYSAHETHESEENQAWVVLSSSKISIVILRMIFAMQDHVLLI